MKRLFYLIPLAVLLMAGVALAADLQWDQTDIAIVDGYVVYFNETGQTDAPYNKAVLKSALNVAGTVITYQNFEPALNLQIGQQYDIWVKAYNTVGVSASSNVVQDIIPVFTPPADSLPSGAQIIIPNGPVMIRIP
jgi:hypothetical protein